MPLHSGQKQFLLTLSTDQFREDRQYRRYILTCANRWGKSALVACLQIWFLFYKHGIPAGDTESWTRAEYRTANIAPHSANTEPVFKAIHQIMTSSFTYFDKKQQRLVTNDCLITWFYLVDRTINTPPYKQFFDNNSYIEHRSLGADQGDALQGRPYGLITYDEGGRSDHLEQEMRDAIMPRLMDWRGPFCIMSTPSQNSKSILYYYQLYQDGLVGANQTYTQTGSLKDNELLTEAQIKDQYDLYKNDPLGDQVLEGKFIFGGDTIFSAQSILNAQDQSLNDGERYQDGHRYVIGTDTAIGKDEMVHTVLDVTEKPLRLVRMKAAKGSSKSPQMHLYDFIDLAESYAGSDKKSLDHALETWNGESARFYLDLPPWLRIITKTYGSYQPDRHVTDNKNKEKEKSNNVKKADLIIALRKALEAGELKIPSDNDKLIQQLSIYREDDSKIPNDRVMSLALAVWMATEGTAYAKEISFLDWWFTTQTKQYTIMVYN